MALANTLFVNKYFPMSADEIPFGDLLNGVFFTPAKDNHDYPIHGPNVIRFIIALLDNDFANTCGILPRDRGECRRTYQGYYPKILSALEIDPANAKEIENVTELLKVAALYHDIGKFIRRANHPQIGANIIRNYSESESEKLVDFLVFDDEPADTTSKHNRFTLIASIIEHHDKFGVVSTGEGALPIFSDILYFTSNKGALNGIKKNITSVMLVNLADIAAVNTSSQKEIALNLARNIAKLRCNEPTDKEFENYSEKQLLENLEKLYSEETSCLGLATLKVSNVLEDWGVLVSAVEDVDGDRTQLKIKLLEIEQNPSRTIKRILRLLTESAITGNASCLLQYMTPTSVESVLVATLGPYRFQSFCEQLATIVKFDYGLDFFKAVMCAAIRKRMHDGYTIEQNKTHKWEWKKLSEAECHLIDNKSPKEKLELTRIITTIFVKVLESLVTRYENILDISSTNPRRFGFQMRDLTLDEKIRSSIIDLLCIRDLKDPVALTWITDEVTIWSMD